MSGKKRGVQYTKQKFPKTMQKKLVMLFGAIILAFLFLIGRIMYISASNGEKYTKIVLEQQQYDSRTIPFKRGDILDRNGTKMATSERVYNVILDAKVMLASNDQEKRNKTISQTKKALEECFGISEEAVDEVIKDNPDGRYNIMMKGATYAQAQMFETMEENEDDKEEYAYISGVWLEDDYVRTYPYNTLASDVIGFTVSGNVGNGGLEASYNGILNGTDGREYGYLDSDASLERTVKQAVNGNSIVSTIDITLQSIVEKHIKAFNDAYKGNVDEKAEGSLNTAVIIANPNNGEILAEASYPNYDLNNPRDLSLYYTEEELAAMTDEQRLDAMNALWKNFCVSDAFEPGSTMKPFTVAAGLETGKLTGGETYNCTGSLKIPGYPNPVKCHKLSGHGIQTLSDAIANSCNVALMHIGEAVGVEDFVKYQGIFGFGQTTGIDLPGEAEGLLFPAEDMKLIDLSTSSFGQSFTVTATQMVAGFSSLINGGNYYEPHIVKQIQDDHGNVIENKDPVLLKKTISQETSQMLKEYMRKTMTEGTGKNAQVEGYDIGAKTGTAQKIPRTSGKHLLSYMGFAPVDSPEVLVYVVIDEPNVENQAVSSYVTDLARNIMTEAFPYLNITKTTETTEE